MLACLVKGTDKPAGNGHTPPEEMERLLALRALGDHPPVHGGVIAVHSTFLHACFDMACAQRRRHRPADAQQHDLLREVGPFDTDPPWSLPLMLHRGSARGSIPQSASNKHCDKTARSRWWGHHDA